MSKKDVKQNNQVEENQEDGTQEIFPGGPTKNMVENWKQKYGDIYMTEFDSETYVWRTLNRIEYKKIMNTEGVSNSEWFGEEQVAQKCVLFPEKYGANDIVNGKAGIPSVLSDHIMAKSGFAANGTAIKL